MLLGSVAPEERLWRGKRKTHLPGSLLAVGSKLFLACCQFLPSPEAHVVDFLVVVVDLVEVMRMLARDIIPMKSIARRTALGKCDLRAPGAKCSKGNRVKWAVLRAQGKRGNPLNRKPPPV
jgi:hypothetical protein